MIVLYITFITFGDKSSGSTVRPQRMYDAFLRAGYEVKLVSGNDMYRNGREERLESISEAYKWLDTNVADYCYVENSTSPIKLNENWRLLRKVHRKGIPIGYFYRDFYYKFPISLGHGMVKDMIYRAMYFRDECNIRRYVDVMYLPSPLCSDFFRHGNKKILPPGVDIPEKIQHETPPVCVYVGGVNRLYGTYMMVEAFDIIHKNGHDIKLKLICRESELNSLPMDYVEELKKKEWISIIHSEGDELKSILSQAAVGLVPIIKSFYSRQAIPVKISDYISAGLSIISTPLDAEISFIGDSKVCRFSADDSADSFAESIIEFFSNESYRNESRGSIMPFAIENSWAKRVESLENDLLY